MANEFGAFHIMEKMNSIDGNEVASATALIVRIELSYRCNLRCRMCDFSLPAGPERMERAGSADDLSEAVFERVCEEILPFTEECVVGVRAEPMMSRNFGQRLTRIVQSGVPKVRMYTNGTLLTPESIALICALNLWRITISIDGLSAATFNDFRLGASFDHVRENVKALIANRGSNRFPLIQWNFVMMRRNLRELPGLITLAAEMGVDIVNAFHVVVHDGLNLNGESCLFCPEETNEVLEMAWAVAHATGVQLHAPRPQRANIVAQELENRHEDIVPDYEVPVDQRRNGPVCGKAWREMMVDHMGRVFPCVFWYKDPSLGDLSQQSFEDIWNGEAYRALRMADPYHIENFSCNHCPVAADLLQQSLEESVFLP